MASHAHLTARSYGKQGRDAEAAALHLRALSIWEETVGLEHPYAAEDLVHLARIYVKQARYAEADSVAGTLDELAAGRRAAGQAEEADSLAARAQAIRDAADSH